MVKIKKSTGVTRTEELLATLCERVFLKLWCYSNPYKDDHNGKEMCDLLAVFDNHVFVFFDREMQLFNKLDDLSSDEDWKIQWGRWKREVVDKQIRTAYGAENYLKSGREIFLDKDRKTPFPIDIDRSNMIVHKIIVAHGADKACKHYLKGKLTGSLPIIYALPKAKSSTPFVVKLDQEKPVHILDSYNLKIILSELDTVVDLAAYLEAKVEAIHYYKALRYYGEEDMLAHYFLNYNEKQKRYRVYTDQSEIEGAEIPEGKWLEFRESKKYQWRKDANEISYLWDAFIQRTCQNALDDILIGKNILLGKSAVYEMAKESRTARRHFAESINESILKFPENGWDMKRRFILSPNRKTGYVFLQIKRNKSVDYEKAYRPECLNLLEISCGALRNRCNHIENVVGIGIEPPKFSTETHEDFILMECAEWSNELREKYEDANKKYGFFRSGDIIHSRSYDFPDNPNETVQRRMLTMQRRKPRRNDACPCGSGKKFKRCCMS